MDLPTTARRGAGIACNQYERSLARGFRSRPACRQAQRGAVAGSSKAEARFQRLPSGPPTPETRPCAAERPELALPAAFARVHGVVAATADVHCLLDCLRAVARGESRLPELSAATQRAAAARLGTHDRAILAMRLAGTPERDIARTVGLHRRALPGRYARIVAALRGCGSVPAQRGPAFFTAGA
jgi:hypothetical protein